MMGVLVLGPVRWSSRLIERLLACSPPTSRSVPLSAGAGTVSPRSLIVTDANRLVILLVGEIRELGPNPSSPTVPAEILCLLGSSSAKTHASLSSIPSSAAIAQPVTQTVQPQSSTPDAFVGGPRGVTPARGARCWTCASILRSRIRDRGVRPGLRQQGSGRRRPRRTHPLAPAGELSQRTPKSRRRAATFTSSSHARHTSAPPPTAAARSAKWTGAK